MATTLTTGIEVKQISADKWQTLDLITYSSDLTKGVPITVPIGFITDFASTPEFVWSLGMPKSGIYDPAAVVHDYLYVQAGHLPGRGDQIPKSTADLIFQDALKFLGVGNPKRWMMYIAVKEFGKGNY